MFMMTLSKPGLKKLGTLALCGVMLAGVVTGVNRWRGENGAEETAGAMTVSAEINTTQDIGSFFVSKGFEVDLTTAAVDQVKIPRRWDDSFAAFNEVVKQSGLNLEKYKGKTVEKWMALCPARSQGERKIYGVLLVYKQKPVGAYLLAQPGGEVTGLQAAAQTAIPLSPEELEASADFGAAAETAAPPETIEGADAPLPEEAQPVEAGAEPIE